MQQSQLDAMSIMLDVRSLCFHNQCFDVIRYNRMCKINVLT